MAQNQEVAVDAAVINTRLKAAIRYLVPVLLGISVPLMAAILPEDRADTLFHVYDGGGITISGPSLLFRKSIGENTSVSYNFYIDSITSASVDVLTYGSPYTEKRTENDLSVEYLSDKTTLSLGAAKSVENDYDANTVFFGVSHGMFGDLTTVSLGYSSGSDTITKTGDLNFIRYLTKTSYKIDISQILTKSIVLNLGYEAITEEGYLQNPYRNILTRVSATEAVSAAEENYPNTRTSNAVALRAMYYMPYRAKLYGELRGFSDSWDITASSWMLGYTQPLGSKLILDIHHRVYTQTQAAFFLDTEITNNRLELRGRDKELDDMTSVTTGVSLHYKFFNRPWWIFDRGTLSAALDRVAFTYGNYVDRRKGGEFRECNGSACETYAFDANVYQFYLSVWY